MRAWFEPPRERRLLPGIDGEQCGEVVPSRVMPEWPEDAERRGIDHGFVLVEFDVAEQGAPRNLRVLESSPGAAFEDAALSAISGWRYCPVIRDGQPVARDNVRVRLRFEREA